MDAMACDICRHIFVADLERQVLKMADRQPPLTWHWNGTRWTGVHLEGVEWGWFYWVFSMALVVLPTTIIALSTFTFPPNQIVPCLGYLMLDWSNLFLSSLYYWLASIEFYQFPLGTYLRVRRQQLFGRLNNG
jgi:hypothetical protein